MSAFLGCIADDFTGGTDLCENLFLNGMRPIQFLGLPSLSLLKTAGESADAFVVSLKIRTCPVEAAVRQVKEAFHSLRACGCSQFYWKYCSTFDSTSQGNIGPVADMLLEELGASSAIICPSNPENGRTVYQAHLFVYDLLLKDTHMAQHPLTPMKESDLRKLLASQTSRGCGNIPLTVMRNGKEAVARRWKESVSSGAAHIIADAISKEDLQFWADFCSDHPLLTGGSSLAGALASNWREAHPPSFEEHSRAQEFSVPAEPPLILVGSCSAATHEQIRVFSRRYRVFKLEPQRLLGDGLHLEETLRFARERLKEGEPALIHSSGSPQEVKATQKLLGREAAGELIERSLAAVARHMKDEGVRKFVVAGGETSGAVVQALGIKALRVGKSIAPGVPWVCELGENPLTFALKSGNFGGDDFFLKAL